MKTDNDVCCLVAPIGNLDIYYRRRPFTIMEIILPRWETDAGPIGLAPVFLKTSSRKARPLAAECGGLHETAALLTDYFKGNVIKPPWHFLNMEGLSVLAQRVLRVVADIPYGALRSYGDIAAAVDHPTAFRFVGNTMAKNPFPILIPCHRVVRRNGGIGGFGGGADLKKRLIAFENENTLDI